MQPDADFDAALLEALGNEAKGMDTFDIFKDIEKLDQRLSLLDDEIKFIHDMKLVLRREVDARLARGLDGPSV